MLRKLFLILLFVSVSTAYAETASDTLIEAYAPVPEQRTVDYVDGFILGLVEGITEFLPVSSTGHLIVSNYFLGLDNDRIVQRDKSDGSILMDRHGEVLTLKHVCDAYVVIIQFGAILAVALIYWKRILSILSGLLGRDKKGLLLCRNLLMAFIPAAVIGLLLDRYIEHYLFGIAPVAFALFAGGILMLIVDRWRKRKALNPGPEHKEIDLSDLTVRQSMIIGFLQCIAMWPGTSRSMMTIVGGYLVGLNPVRSAEFSFLLGLITLTAASAYKTLQMGTVMMKTLSIGPIAFGLLVACLSAFFAVRWMIAYLTKHGLGIFAYYRFLLAFVLVVIIVLSV